MTVPRSAIARGPVTSRTRQPAVLVASRYGTLWLVDAVTGRVRWRRMTEGRVPAVTQGRQHVYALSIVPLAVRRALGGDEPASPGEPRPHAPLVAGHPARLLALHLADGGVAWEREGWASSERQGFALNGEVLVADGPTLEIGRRIVYGLDATTGAERWSFDAGAPWGYTERLFGAGSGRVYVYAGDTHRLDVLDSRTGAVVWSIRDATPFATLSQPNGVLIAATIQPNPATPAAQRIYCAADGSIVGKLRDHGILTALADDGVAYFSGDSAVLPRASEVVAVRVATGDLLWRTRGVLQGVHGQCIVRGDRLYVCGVTRPHQRAEVVALDRRTGERLWRWRSPGSLIALLALWGWRTPRVVRFALAQLRRNRRHARDFPPYRRQSGRRAAVAVFWRELLHGQWRRPGHLIGRISVAADDERVYVGTNLGLFAISARVGRREWYALPMMELGGVTPSVTPVGAATSP